MTTEQMTQTGTNDPPNTTVHSVGALVIHDCDAKRDDMLMRVVGYDSDGMVRTVYVDTERQLRSRRKYWVNDLKYLHAPERVGMIVPPEAR